jgi:hypothetical protein
MECTLESTPEGRLEGISGHVDLGERVEYLFMRFALTLMRACAGSACDICREWHLKEHPKLSLRS